MVCGFSVGSVAVVMFLCLLWPRAHSAIFGFLLLRVCVCVACLILPNSIFLYSSANSSNYLTTHLPTQSDTNEQTDSYERDDLV